MKSIKVKGIVIKEVKTGEADKIITIFTEKYGMIQAVAKGARRPRSKLIAGTQFLSFSDFVLYKGKDIYTITDCQAIESFFNIKEDLSKLTYAAHIVDLVYKVSDENLSYYSFLKLILNSLHVLINSNKSPELIIRVFEIRLISIIGYTPQIIECTNCESTKNLLYFSSKSGGILCDKCNNLDQNAIKISLGTLNALKYIIYSKISKIFSFEVSQSVLNELIVISKQFLSEHLDIQFNKLDFLQNVNINSHKTNG